MENTKWHQVRLSLLSEQWRTFRLLGALIWKSGPLLVLSLIGCMLLSGLAPVLQLYASKQIIDGLTVSDSHGSHSLFWAGAYAGSMVVLVILSSLQIWAGKILSERSMLTINLMLLQAWESVPGMKFFDQKAYRNRLEALRDASEWLPVQLITISMSFVTGFVSLAGIIVLIGNLSIILALLLVLSTIPFALKQNRYGQMDWEYEKQSAEERRRMNYARDLLLGRRAAKEIRLFGAGDYFKRMYREMFTRIYTRYQRLQRRFAYGSVMTGLLSGGVAGLGYMWIAYRIGSGNVTLGEIAMYLLAVFQLSHALRETAKDGADALELWRMGDDFRLFIEAEPDIAAPALPVETVKGTPMAIEFRDVYFKYESSRENDGACEQDAAEEDEEAANEECEGEGWQDQWDADEQAEIEQPSREFALEGISFSIAPGECVALVGANGSGKTTLVKLICRFYQATSGSILVDGVEVEKLAIQQLRDRISAVFQDYGQYAVSVEENICLTGHPGLNAAELASAAAQAQADDFIERLPHRYHTLLGPEWGGVDLSGGQWQRLAIARAIYRGADLLILDEPAAALDIQAEYELFQQFRQLTAGKSVLLISHRFSTVKMANRILVLQDGRIIEEGSHAELMKLGGEYAHMYQLQAAAFRADA
ncbi:ABC transporter ATP-binding protein [Paenibacillus tarimensis]